MLKRTFTAMAALALSAPVLAQTTKPARAPAAVPAATPAIAGTKVLVVPLTEVSDGAKRDWLGRAMHQSMLAELSRLGFVDPITAKNVEPATVADLDAATKAGKDAGAAFVVFGSYQIVDDELRVTGQIADVSTGKAAGGIKATGNVRDLFGVEDVVAAQLKKTLTDAVKPALPADQGLAVAAPTTAPSAAPATPPVAAATPASGAPASLGYEGSDLQKDLNSSSPIADGLQSIYDKYRYGTPERTYPGYGNGGYDYPSDYGYQPRIVAIVPTGTDGTGAGQPADVTSNNANNTGAGTPASLPKNGNYNDRPESLGGNQNTPQYPNANTPQYPNYNTPRSPNYNGRSPGSNAGARGGNSNTAPTGGSNTAGSTNSNHGTTNTARPTGGNSVTPSSSNTNTAGTNSNSR